MKGWKSLEQDIEKIYQEHGKTVYNYLFCLCKNQSLAEDLVQETFYIASKKIEGFHNKCKIEVWLCRIAKNLWYQELKRVKKFATISMDSEIGEIKSDFNLEENFIENMQKAELYKEIEKLESPIKELIYLKLTSELTFKDIAQILGKSEPWTRVTFYRWKTKMKEMNQKEEQ